MYWVPIIAMSPNDFMNPTCHQRAIPSGIPIESYTGSQAIGMVVIVTHVLELRIMLVTGTHVVHCCTKLTNTSTCKQRHGTFIQNITLSFNGTLVTNTLPNSQELINGTNHEGAQENPMEKLGSIVTS